MGKRVKVNKKRGETAARENEELLSDIRAGAAKAMAHIDDHKLLKVTLLQICPPFLCGTSKRVSRSTSSGVNECDRLGTINRRIETMVATIEREKKIHADDMARLARQHGAAQKLNNL